MLVLRTPKGWHGPKEFNGELIEGSFHAHQVPLPNAKTSDAELTALQTWLSSYKPQELFTKDGLPVPEIMSIIPSEATKKLGQKPESYRGYIPLDVPDWRALTAKKGTEDSCMKAVGRLLKEVVKQCVNTTPSFTFINDPCS